MKYFIVLTWFFATLSFISCSERIYINKSKNEIENFIKINKKDPTISKFINNKDTLAYIMDYESGPLELYFLFDSLSLCEKEVLKIYCSHCAEEYLNLIKEG